MMPGSRIPSILQHGAAALLALLALASSAHAQQRDLEPAVKATFVTRFASFVQWPAEGFPGAADPVVICVAGDGAFAELVELAARGEQIGARSIVVRRFSTLPSDVGCHVLYAAGAPGQSAAQMLDVVRGQGVLTVTDERRGRARGMIHFVLDRGRVRFHVDRDAANAAHLNVSSRLLSVALSVRSRGAS